MPLLGGSQKINRWGLIRGSRLFGSSPWRLHLVSTPFLVFIFLSTMNVQLPPPHTPTSTMFFPSAWGQTTVDLNFWSLNPKDIIPYFSYYVRYLGYSYKEGTNIELQGGKENTEVNSTTHLSRLPQLLKNYETLKHQYCELCSQVSVRQSHHSKAWVVALKVRNAWSTGGKSESMWVRCSQIGRCGRVKTERGKVQWLVQLSYIACFMSYHMTQNSRQLQWIKGVLDREGHV